MHPKYSSRLFLALLLPWFVFAAPLAADDTDRQVFAYTLEHRATGDALDLVRPLLSAGGALEEQPGSNTLVVRDTAEVIERVKTVLETFDQLGDAIRFEIQLVHAGPRRNVISPPNPAKVDRQLSPELAERLRTFLRYDDFRVIAQVGVTSNEGEAVSYALGDEYDVSFRPGNLLLEQRLRLESFRLVKKNRSTNKGRRLPPRELLHANLNLWVDKPFTLVLTQDEERGEALMVAISVRPEGPTE